MRFIALGVASGGASYPTQWFEASAAGEGCTQVDTEPRGDATAKAIPRGSDPMSVLPLGDRTTIPSQKGALPEDRQSSFCSGNFVGKTQERYEIKRRRARGQYNR